jgi:hypothetical protein
MRRLLSCVACADVEADGAESAAYHPSSWAEISREWDLFAEAKAASAKGALGARRYCSKNRKQYSAAALGKWGKLLARMETSGATVSELDKEMFPVSVHGLDMWLDN